MKDTASVSVSVVARLPRYYRFLCDLSKRGVERVSSKELSVVMGLTASQIRQDFNCFGGFGQQGYGYNVEQLKKELGAILGLQTEKSAVLIGAGNLGRTIATHLRFEALGFRLTAIFDSAPSLQREWIRGLPVQSAGFLREYCLQNAPEMAILCLPENQAPAVVETLLECGVNAFWNFSHYDVHTAHPDALVENVHLSDSLMTLSYKMNNSKER